MQTELVETYVDVDKLINDFNYEIYFGKIVVKEIEIQETLGGIVIPESSKDTELKTDEGHVIALGEGVDFCVLKDVVLYARYSGAPFSVKGEKLRIMNEKDLIAKRKK